MKKKEQIKRTISNNLFLLNYIWKFAPLYLILSIATAMMNGVFSSMFTIYTKLFYDAIAEGRSFSYMIIMTLIVFGIDSAGTLILNYYYAVVCDSEKQKLKLGMIRDIFYAARKIDLACYDDTSFYNDFIWSMNIGDLHAVAMVESLTRLLRILVTMITSATIIATINPMLAVIAVAVAVLSVIISRFGMKLGVKRHEALNPLQRRCDYYERVFSLPDTAKEVRISHVSDVVIDHYDETLEEVRRTSQRFNLRGMKFSFPNDLLEKMLEPAIYALLLYQIMVSHTATIGGLAVAVSTFWSVRWNLQNFLKTLLKFEEHSLFVEKVRTLLEYKPKVRCGTLPAPQFDSLTFQNVSFGYRPDKEVLHDVSFTIHRGEKIALVGYNGAGKSTIIKLIMHFYEPTQGKILLNGRDLGEYDNKSYLQTVGTVFQDFQLYALTLAENVLCDEVEEGDTERICAALERATFKEKLDQLPQGIQTEITKEFYESGTNLSGGEAQKVAIARVFVRPYEIILLDEPSSALDPMAEYELNRQINTFLRDQTVVFISHRLSTTRHVDRIYMFDDGRLIEQGSHDELMRLDGKYAEMFRIQGEKYMEKEKDSQS